jgi:hypothetical protein
MMFLVLITILVGAVLGLRFKAFVLVPVICVAMFMVAVGGVARGDDLWHLAGLTIGITTALQLGYISGSVARLVMERPGAGSTTEIEEEAALMSGGTAGWWSESLGRFDHTEPPHNQAMPEAPWGGQLAIGHAQNKWKRRT